MAADTTLDADQILADANVLLAEEIAGLDALEIEPGGDASRLRAFWSATWPKVAAVGLALLFWQLVVWSHWKPEYILPGPNKVVPALWEKTKSGVLPRAVATTMRRAVTGFAIAVLVGCAIGLVVSTFKLARVAFGSLITGLQTMPSVAWFPLALVLFKQSEAAIFFVIMLGAAPSIANGLLTGVDNIPPILTRAGRVLGAGRLAQIRHVVLPGALPSFVSGLRQGWAFAWRSLLAGELIVIIANKPSIGSRLDFDRQFNDYPSMMATMLVILLIGVVIDSLVFTQLDRAILRRRGLAPAR
ncbi:MAG: ABC transporter permease [Ilumatobacteraceae bacterium]